GPPRTARARSMSTPTIIPQDTRTHVGTSSTTPARGGATTRHARAAGVARMRTRIPGAPGARPAARTGTARTGAPGAEVTGRTRSALRGTRARPEPERAGGRFRGPTGA